MPTLNLLFERIKKSFIPKELNLLFVFQINCPKCFIYGIPTINELFKKYNDDDFGILGLSTAFKDFEFNTLENTLLLLEKKLLVGATQKYLGKKYEHPILFPVAMDKPISKEELMTEKNIEKICQLNSNYNLFTQREKQLFRKCMIGYLIRFPSISCASKPFIFYTFSMNRLSGTPTFILFNKNMQIIYNWFGSQNIHQIELIINQYKMKHNMNNYKRKV